MVELSDIPRGRFPDEIEYWRARALRMLALLGAAMNLLQMPIQILARAPAERVGGNFCSMLLMLLVFFIVGRSPRALRGLGYLTIPIALAVMAGASFKGEGIYDPGMFAGVSAVLFGGLCLGVPGVLVTTPAAVAITTSLAVATAKGWIPKAPHGLDPGNVTTLALTGSVTVVLVASLYVAVDWLLRRSIELREVASARADELSELDAAKTVFLQNMSHEFRQPITLVLSPIEERLRQTDRDPPDLRRMLTMARRNLRRLLRMVGGLLDLAAIETGGMAVSREPQDLPVLTRALAGEFAGPVAAAGLTLRIDCPAMDQPVWVDRRMWETILMNLLSNALKFTMQGEIVVSLRQVGDEVELRVRDTGCGIAKEDRPKLFQRFQRFHPTEARSHEGSGIGLALVAELVRMHQGHIGAESEPGQGAAFWVRLPLRPKQEAADAQRPAKRRPRAESVTPGAYVDEAMTWIAPVSGSQQVLGQEEDPDEEAEGAAAPEGPAAQEERRPLVLLADDNADMRRFLAQELGRRWRVRAVPDGQAVLDAVEEELPDLILSDVMMPRLDGISMVRELRRHPRAAGLPIILISARASHGNTIQGLEARADDYIIKPFVVEELLARIKVHMELHLARRDAALKQDRFVKMLVHELRGPLTVIKGSTDMVIDRLASKDRDNAGLLRHASKGIVRMDGLLSELADAARIEAGGLVLRPERFDLAELCIEVADEQEMATDREVALDVPSTPLMVDGDRERIGQVLGNLIGNAIKYDPAGEPVTLSLRVEGGEAVVTVRDHGIGIGEADLERVFEANYRTAEAQKVARGIGMGLYVCRHIIDLHGGRILARREDVGTSFVFALRLPGAAPGPGPGGAAIETITAS